MKTDLELLEIAWGIIANAGEGDWNTQHVDWVQAAERWRDEYHERLGPYADRSSEGRLTTAQQIRLEIARMLMPEWAEDTGLAGFAADVLLLAHAIETGKPAEPAPSQGSTDG